LHAATGEPKATLALGERKKRPEANGEKTLVTRHIMGARKAELKTNK